MKKIYFIVGPTASGKTSLSIKLANEKMTAEIVSADSRQVFKDLDLSTGKVTKEEMQNIPHHMLDVINPGEYFSVVDYTKMAVQKIEEILGRGNIPIIVGGTGFYIDSILYKYNLPEVKADFELRSRLEQKNKNELFEILEKLDNQFANRHDNSEFRNNPHRLVRAIEIAAKLGKIPELKKELRYQSNEFVVEIIHTNLTRQELKENISKRLAERLNKGILEEIVGIKEKYSLSYQYLEGLGLEFKWVSKYLKNEVTIEKMIENLNKEIYQYARRQESWFKRYNKEF